MIAKTLLLFCIIMCNEITLKIKLVEQVEVIKLIKLRSKSSVTKNYSIIRRLKIHTKTDVYFINTKWF